MRTILLLAYAVSPYKGSEYAVAWNYIREMSATNRIIVLYGKSDRDMGNFREMREYLNHHSVTNVRFVEVTANSRWGKEGVIYTNFIKTALYDYLAYESWHMEAYKTAEKIIADETVDVVHFLNPIGFKEPGYLWKLDKPYVWGPIAGAHPRPYPLFKALSSKEKVIAVGRNVIHPLMLRFMPRVVSAAKRADVIISATPHTRIQLKEYFARDTEYLPENGILEIENTSFVQKSDSENLKIIWIGTLCPRKGLSILLDSLSLLREKTAQWELHVIAGGDMETALKEEAIRKGVDRHIVWHGFIPRAEVQKILQDSHVHVISSLGEATTTVLFEAMAKSIPTITLDHCGMAGVVCSKCGIKIPLNSYEQVTRDLADSLYGLACDSQRLSDLSKGAFACAHEYLWSERVKFFNRQIDKAISCFEQKTAT